MPKRFHLNRPDRAKEVIAAPADCDNVSDQQRLLAMRLDGGANRPVRPDGQLVLQGFHGAFDFAIDVKVFAAENLANYFDGLPNGGRTSARVRLKSGWGHAGHG